MDSQITEIIGRHHLIGELLAAGFEVAEPIRDRGIDLIVYLDIDAEIDHFMAIPIQIKVNTNRRFSVDSKYNKFPNLLLAHIWDISSPTEAVTYALTQHEVIQIATEMGWITTTSYTEGRYTSAISKRLLQLLEPHRMTKERWRSKLLEVASKVSR